MPTAASRLHTTIDRLRAQRQQYVEAVAQIDAQFARHGIRVDGPTTTQGPRRKTGRPRKPGRPARKPVVAAATKRTRKYARYAQTADQFVLEYVQQNPSVSTGQINQAWKAAGRKGSANVTLTKLVKTKTLARESLAEGRGSSFRTAVAATVAV